jgi:hypothetical protein
MTRFCPILILPLLGLGCGTSGASPPGGDGGAGGTMVQAGGGPASSSTSSSSASSGGGGGTSSSSSSSGGGGGGPALNGWTLRIDVPAFSIQNGLSPNELFVDPHVANRVAVRFQHSATSTWFIVWDDGVFGDALTAASESNIGGAGFSGDGGFYILQDLNSGAVVHRLPTAAGSWTTFALDQGVPATSGWPPSRMDLAHGSLPRIGLFGGNTFFEATGKLNQLDLFEVAQPHQATWDPTTLDGDLWAWIRMLPERSDGFLAQSTFAKAIVDCSGTFPLVCTQIATLPEVATGVWTTPAAPDQVLARIDATTLLASHDAGASFASVQLPAGVANFDVGISPIDAASLVLWTNGSSDLWATHDLGATWSALPWPETTITSLSGAGVDAAGRLFLLRGGTLFSRASW